jgi:hypothetical protein
MLWFVVPSLLAALERPESAKGLDLLSFDELVKLSDTDEPAAPLMAKLNRLLTTPFWGN